MKPSLLLLLSLFGLTQLHAQCDPPPPPGYNPIYSIDLDNDGFTTFDIGYYIINEQRPLMEEIHNVSSSGYDFIFYNSNNQISNLIYTNIQVGEFCSIHYEYTGSGPVFQPVPPCYWPVPTEGSIRLIAVPFDGDSDGDGILNVDEDTNHNLNLMDDDDDNDGIINFEDPLGLALNGFNKTKLVVYPNPVENGLIYFKSDTAIATITIYDLAGKQIITRSVESNSLNVNTLASGMYLIKFESENALVLRKILIR